MQLWDNLQREGAAVFIIGATNTPQDLDAAVQRRFERSFLIGPPDETARREVFSKALKDVVLDRRFDFDLCARRTKGYTGSDIAAVCKAAANIPLQEALVHQEQLQGGSTSNQTVVDVVRPLRTVVRRLANISHFHIFTFSIYFIYLYYN